MAEIVGDKLLYTTGLLATRYKTFPILCGMAMAFMLKMAVAVLVGHIFALLPKWLVASVTAITGLEGLDLQETAVTDAGLATLRGMEELTFINVRRCPTSGPGIIYPRGRDGPDYGRGLRQFLDQNERRR